MLCLSEFSTSFIPSIVEYMSSPLVKEDPNYGGDDEAHKFASFSHHPPCPGLALPRRCCLGAWAAAPLRCGARAATEPRPGRWCSGGAEEEQAQWWVAFQEWWFSIVLWWFHETKWEFISELLEFDWLFNNVWKIWCVITLWYNGIIQ